MDNFIGNNIYSLRVHFGLSQEELAKGIGVTQATVSAWECGQSTPRKANALKIMAALPGITFDDIMSEDRGFASKSTTESDRKPEHTAWIEVPLYGSIAAGKPIEMFQIEDTFTIPRQMRERYPDSFLLKVCGESMNKILPNGSYALVNPTSEAIDGKAYAVAVNGYDATIKRVRHLDNGIELLPDSTDPTIRPMVFDYADPEAETVTVIGEVVWYVVPFDFMG